MRFNPLVFGALAAIVWPTARAEAQPEVEPKDGRVTYKMTLHPAAVSKPALKYKLFPDIREQIPGNKVQMFLRCFSEHELLFGAESQSKRDKLKFLSLDELAKEAKEYPMPEDVADAARMNKTDWQVEYFMKRDGFKTSFLNILPMRNLADVIILHARCQIAAHDYGGAIQTTSYLLSFAQTFDEHPTLFGAIMGLAIENRALAVVQELIAQPGCPNLYWALTDLPAPIISGRRAVNGEKILFHELQNRIRESQTDEMIAAHMNEIFSNPFEPADQKLDFKKYVTDDDDRLKKARARLIESNFDSKQVAIWSATRVIAMDEFNTCTILREEHSKWFNTPFAEAQAGIHAVEEEAKKSDSPFIKRCLTPTLNIKPGLTRSEQHIAAFRIIEAIRLYAHEHGELPRALDKIKLPIPVDPVSGKAFEYSGKDGVATLHGVNAIPNSPDSNRYYELRLKK